MYFDLYGLEKLGGFSVRKNRTTTATEQQFHNLTINSSILKKE